jgi:hypothetical protein
MHQNAHVQVGGILVVLPYTGSCYKIDYDGNSVRLETTFGLSVKFDGNWLVVIQVPDDYKGLTHGICGNNNDNKTDDLTTCNGTFVGNQQDPGSLIGNSCVVPDNSNVNQR